MQNIMGNNMLIAVEAKADYVSAILKVANSALLSKLQYRSAVPRDTRKTSDEQRRWQVGNPKPCSAKHFPYWAAVPRKPTPDYTHTAWRRMPASALAPWMLLRAHGTTRALSAGTATSLRGEQLKTNQGQAYQGTLNCTTEVFICLSKGAAPPASAARARYRYSPLLLQAQEWTAALRAMPHRCDLWALQAFLLTWALPFRSNSQLT